MSGIVSVYEATGADSILVTACDMPFIMPEMIEYITGCAGADPLRSVVPYPQGRPEPLLALYRAGDIEAMRDVIDSGGDTSLRRMVENLDVRRIGADEINSIDPGGVCFINVNTPEDLQEALDRSEGQGKGGQAK